MSMLFKSVTPTDAPLLRSHIEKYGAHGALCDYTAAVILLFRRRYRTEYAFQGDTLYLRMTDGGRLYYAVPVGGELETSLDALEAFLGKTPDFCAVPESLLPCFLSRYPSAFVEDDRDWYDYLYENEKLASLEGRHYHGQRNQIARFERTYGKAELLPLTSDNAHEALSFLDTYADCKGEMSEEARAELVSVRELLESDDFYGQTGGILVASGRVFGFVLGERVGDTVFDHVEKADPTAVGAYQTLVNLFAREYRDVSYMNREEDCGVEGLRKSKLAYHPCALLKKFTVIQTTNSEESEK